MGNKNMSITDLVTGQNIINAKRKEIDAYLRIVNAFIATCTSNARFFSNSAYLKVGGGCPLSLGMQRAAKVALYRGFKGESKSLIVNADALRLDEIDLAHECLAEATDRFITQLHVPESFAAFSKPFLDQAMPETWIIEVTEKGAKNFHAQLRGHPGKWDAGKTRTEAIAQLLIS